MLPLILAAVGGYLIGNSIDSKDKYADGGIMADGGGRTRQMQLQEIERFVHQQGTVVQEENFEEVPVQHLRPNSLEIKGIDIPYVGTDAVYSANGKKYSYSNLSDDDIKKIHYRIIGMYN